MAKALVRFQNQQKKEPTPKALKDLIRAAVAYTLRAQGISSGELSVLFVDRRGIRQLNATFRSIDRETDVLSFPSGETKPLNGMPLFLGDMALCLETARGQACAYGHSYAREIAFLTAHSVLHCLGHDHETKEEEEIMFCLQNQILSEMGLPR